MVHIHTRAYKNTRTQTHIHMVVPRLSIPTGLKFFGFTASEGNIVHLSQIISQPAATFLTVENLLVSLYSVVIYIA